MGQAGLEPVIIEDLVKFGEDLGYARGYACGYAQGKEHIYARWFARRLGRALTPNERDTLTQRLGTLDIGRLNDVLFSSQPAAVEAWLADANAS